MGLLLKAGINIDLINSALLAFSCIAFFILITNFFAPLKNTLPNYSLQLAGLIGNTSFLGIPIAIALLPTDIINFTIGFDLGTTLFSWIFGPYLLQKKSKKHVSFNFRKLLSSILNSPASRGIIGVLIIYFFNLDNIIGNFLWLPAKLVIYIAITVVGARLGIITDNKNILLKLEGNIINALLLKLFILPTFVYLICLIFNFDRTGTTALVLQAGTPSAISTILMAEAYNKNRELAAKALFITTIISTATIPIIFLTVSN
tara:strand:+ start:232 stop:1011 length:780 start_codon:yes stop_codon:yes gene_type:complete